jgi:cytochrome b561
LFRVPQFTSTDKASANTYENLHIYLAYLLLALVVIHIVAALYHLLARGDNVANRMIRGEPG